MKGKVLWFDEYKGYGFIRSDDVDSDIFFHWTQIETDDPFKTVFYGQPVEFNIVEENGKYEALNVRKLPFINKETGRELILVTFMENSNEDTIKRFQVEIGGKESKGLKFLRFSSEYIVATSQRIDDEEFDKILHFITSADENGILDTLGELPYDLLLI